MIKNSYRIARWEFLSRFKTRSYLFNTFVTPILFTAIFLIPIYFLDYTPAVSIKLIGIIDLSPEKNMGSQLINALNKKYRLEKDWPEYQIYNVSVETVPEYSKMKEQHRSIEANLDSVSNLHQMIKKERAGYYKNRNTPNRTFALDKSYERLREVREEKELIEIELKRFKVALDSLYEKTARSSADSMIVTNVLNAYLVFPPNVTQSGVIEYHSKNPGELIDTERIEKLLQNILIRKRISPLPLEKQQIREILKPISLEKYKISDKDFEEWNIYAQFYGPLIAVFLLFMSIFTSGSYLFSGLLLEKSNKIIEVLLSYAKSGEIMAGKIFGLGFLGLVQVFIWLTLSWLAVTTGVFSSSGLGYLNLENSFYFLLYFSLGYLFYAAIFVMIGSVFNSEHDAQQSNQLLRMVAIFPVLISLIVLTEPNSAWIRFLSYVPFLTPSFMILRIPLSPEPLTTDIIITTIIMFVFIIIVVFIAGKVFRVSTLLSGKKHQIKDIVNWIKKS